MYCKSFIFHIMELSLISITSRGKKVFRRFDDGDDDEEELEPHDLGLLEHTPTRSSVKPMKTLTRRSIKPTRLFQTEAQKYAHVLEKEEEALTDIEGNSDVDVTGSPARGREDAILPASKTSRSLRSTKKVNPAGLDEAHPHDVGVRQSKKSSKASPFDSWRRVKAAVHPAETTARSRKRAANEAVEE